MSALNGDGSASQHWMNEEGRRYLNIGVSLVERHGIGVQIQLNRAEQRTQLLLKG